jgi:hypothetical protein
MSIGLFNLVNAGSRRFCEQVDWNISVSQSPSDEGVIAAI